MYKFLLLFLAPLFQLSALYMGNPSEPDLIQKGIFICEEMFMKFKVGYQGDFVFDRRLKAYDGAQGRMDTFAFHMDQGVLTLNFIDRIEAFGSVGAMATSFSNHPQIDHKRREYQSNDHTTWGVGVRGILLQWKKATIGLEGGFQWANPHLKWNTLDGVGFTTGAVMRYREWQMALGASYQVDLFVPYAAVKYSNVHALLSQLRHNLMLGHGSFKMRNRDHFGIVLGCTLTSGKLFDFTVEVRMIDEQALSLTGNVKF